MKKYTCVIFGIVILATAVICFAAGVFVQGPEPQQESAVPATIYETETVTEPRLVINQKDVEPVSATSREEFYLVSETGYLLVFDMQQFYHESFPTQAILLFPFCKGNHMVHLLYFLL